MTRESIVQSALDAAFTKHRGSGHNRDYFGVNDITPHFESKVDTNINYDKQIAEAVKVTKPEESEKGKPAAKNKKDAPKSAGKIIEEQTADKKLAEGVKQAKNDRNYDPSVKGELKKTKNDGVGGYSGTQEHIAAKNSTGVAKTKYAVDSFTKAQKTSAKLVEAENYEADIKKNANNSAPAKKASKSYEGVHSNVNDPRAKRAVASFTNAEKSDAKLREDTSSDVDDLTPTTNPEKAVAPIKAPLKEDSIEVQSTDEGDTPQDVIANNVDDLTPTAGPGLAVKPETIAVTQKQLPTSPEDVQAQNSQQEGEVVTVAVEDDTEGEGEMHQYRHGQDDGDDYDDEEVDEDDSDNDEGEYEEDEDKDAYEADEDEDDDEVNEESTAVECNTKKGKGPKMVYLTDDKQRVAYMLNENVVGILDKTSNKLYVSESLAESVRDQLENLSAGLAVHAVPAGKMIRKNYPKG